MKKLLLGSASVAGGLVVLVAVSSRPLSDLFGYARATADTTVNQLETSLPDDVRDQKVRNQLDDARGQLIDRRVSLSLATGQIQDLQDEIARLKAAIARRETILGDALPAMESAASDRATPVTFAGTAWQPADLNAEIDRLFNEQDRDEIQLKVRTEALERLQASVGESQRAVSDMETRLQQAESDFELLQVRREQAESESELLDLLSAAGRDAGTASGQLANDLSEMEKQVRSKEARNSARRETAPPADVRPSRLTQSYERLERLRTLHQQRQAAAGDAADPATEAANTAAGAPEAPEAPEAPKGEKTTAEPPAKSDVVIVIRESSVQQPAPTEPQKTDAEQTND